MPDASEFFVAPDAHKSGVSPKAEIKLVPDNAPGQGPADALTLEVAGRVLPLSSADEVVWELRPGVQPWVGEFTVETKRAEEWLASADESWGTLVFSGRRFERLRVLRPVEIDPWHTLIRVADRRHRWRYVRFFGRINLRRRVNDPIRFVDLLQAIGEKNLSKDEERDDLRTVQRSRYRRWSVSEDGSPYTAKKGAILVMRAILEELEEDGFDEQGADALADNGDVPDMQELLGATVEESLGALLRRAELKVAIDDDGTIRFVDPYARAQFPSLQFKGGAYSRPDLSRIRPDHYEVYCIAERDRRLVFEQTSAGTGQTAPPQKPSSSGGVEDNRPDSKPEAYHFLENVLQLPHNAAPDRDGKWTPGALRINENGTTRTPTVGTWVTVQQAMTAWGISETDLRSLWFFGGEGLKLKVARRISPLGVPWFDPLALSAVNALLQHYRKTFRIHPRLLDMLRSWEPVTAAVIDPFTHTRQPSPVYGEWYNLYPSLPIMLLTAPNQQRPKMGQNESSFKDNTNSAITDKAKYRVAPAEVKMIDQDLGILRVEYMPAIDGTVVERIPSNVEAEMQVFDPGTRQQLQFLTRNMKLAAAFRLEVVVSTVAGAPNVSEQAPLAGKGLFYGKSFKFDDAQGLVPKLQLFYRGDTARIDENGRIVNGDQIDAMLEAEARASARSFDDRPVGVFHCVHLPGAEWRVTGHVRGIRFARGKDGSERVTVDASEPEAGDNPLRFLPQAVKNYLQKVLPKES